MSSDIKFTTPRVSKYGGKKFSYESNPILKDVHTVWDLSKFQTVRQPIVIGNMNRFEMDLIQEYECFLDMPIKMAGSNEYRIPGEIYHIDFFVKRVAEYEHLINKNVEDYYCYLTLDVGRLKVGETQRRGGCHVDGFQGARIQPKNFINRSYTTSNILPTVFYPHPFETWHLDEEVDNFFLDFDRQAKEDLAWRPRHGEIVLMDAYCVHRADVTPAMLHDRLRVFIRMSYDVRIFDRLGNTHNPMFDYNWEMVPRDVQSTLR